jgi:hypothetical protein
MGTNQQIQANSKTSVQSLKIQEYDTDLILQRFQWYEAMKQESIPQETLMVWVLEFKNMGMSTNQVIKRITQCAKKKSYSKTTFDMFLEEDDIKTDYNLVNKRVENILKEYNINVNEYYLSKEYILKVIVKALDTILYDITHLETKTFDDSLNLIYFYQQNPNKLI